MNRSQSPVLCGLGRQKVFTFLSHSHLQFINIFLPFFHFQLYQNFLLLFPQICLLTCFFPFLCNYFSWNPENPDYCSLCSHLHSGCAFPYLLKLFFCWDPCHWTSMSPVVCWFLRAVFQFISYFWVWWQHMACCPPFSAVCIIFLRSHYCVAESHSLHWRSQTWHAY